MHRLIVVHQDYLNDTTKAGLVVIAGLAVTLACCFLSPELATGVAVITMICAVLTGTADSDHANDLTFDGNTVVHEHRDLLRTNIDYVRGDDMVAEATKTFSLKPVLGTTTSFIDTKNVEYDNCTPVLVMDQNIPRLAKLECNGHTFDAPATTSSSTTRR